MLKGKKLIKVDVGAKFTDKVFNIEKMISYFSEELHKVHFNVNVNADTVKFGGMFNSNILDCIIITNSDHVKDYLKYVLVLNENHTIVNLYAMGESKQLKKQHIKDSNKAYRSSLFNSNMSLGNIVTTSLKNKISSSIKTIGFNEQKLEEELDYIGYLIHLFEEL